MKALGFRAKDAASFAAAWNELGRRHSTLNFCIVFASAHTDIHSLIPTLQGGAVQVFGASSGGEILINEDGPSVSRSSIAGLAMDMPEGHFAVQLFETEGLSSFEAGARAGAWARDTFDHPALMVMSAGLKADGDALIHGIESMLGRDARVYGAMAADDMAFQQTYVFSESRVLSEGLIVCVVDTDRIEVGGIASHGWKEIGEAKTVTRAEGNRVYEIDGRPALEFYRDYVGVESAKELSTALEFPMQVDRDDGTTVLRAVVGINGDRSLVLNGNVPERATIHLSSPPGPAVIDQTIGELEQYRAGFPLAEVGILFHCAVRHHALGDEVEREIRTAGILWKAPLVGVFSYGEIGELRGGRCDFHAATYSLLLMRDRLSTIQVHPVTGLADLQTPLVTGKDVSLRRLGSFGAGLNSILENGRINKRALTHLVNEFARISEDFQSTLMNVERLTVHHFTKSALLTRTSEDLRNKIRKIESLNEDLEATYQLVQREREKSDGLLRNVLPAEIALRMKLGEKKIAEKRSDVTVVFADLVGFTSLCRRQPPEAVVEMLNIVFSGIDRLADRHGLEKIKTIGDCYMAAMGATTHVDDSARFAADFCLDLMEALPALNEAAGMGDVLHLRIGLHTGDVVAGVIGEKRVLFDLWGDTVNTASRMESHSEPGRIHCTGDVRRLLGDRYRFTERGRIEVKGKGLMETHFVDGRVAP